MADGHRRNGIARRTPSRPRRGFTLIEILVVVAIIALLVSILIPSLKNAREQAHVLVCKTRLNQLYNGHVFYAQESRGVFPHWSWWLFDGFNHMKAKSTFSPGVWAISGGKRFPDANSDRWVEYGDIYRYVKDKEVYFCPKDNRVRTGRSIGGGEPNQGRKPIHSYVRLVDPHEYFGNRAGNWSDSALVPADFLHPDKLRPHALKAPGFNQVERVFYTVPNRVVLMYEEYQGSGDVAGLHPVGLNDGHSFLGNADDLLTTRHSNRGNVMYWDGHVELLLASRWNKHPGDRYALYKAFGGGTPPAP